MKRQFKAGQVAKREVKLLKNDINILVSICNEYKEKSGEWLETAQMIRDKNIELKAELMKHQRRNVQLENELERSKNMHDFDNKGYTSVINDLHEENERIYAEKKKFKRLLKYSYICFWTYVAMDIVVGVL